MFASRHGTLILAIEGAFARSRRSSEMQFGVLIALLEVAAFADQLSSSTPNLARSSPDDLRIRQRYIELIGPNCAIQARSLDSDIVCSFRGADGPVQHKNAPFREALAFAMRPKVFAD